MVFEQLRGRPAAAGDKARSANALAAFIMYIALPQKPSAVGAI